MKLGEEKEKSQLEFDIIPIEFMNIERMSQIARESARARVEQIEAKRIVRSAAEIANAGIMDRLIEQMDAVAQAEEEYFESLRPQLEAQARAEHQERFKPLHAMLNEFEAPVKQIRDMYFPNSKIAVKDGYEGNNFYYRALLVLGNVDYPGEGRRLFAVYAVGIKQGGINSSNEPLYRTDLKLEYEPDGSHIQPTEDMEYITDESDLFDISRGEYFFVSSSSGYSRSEDSIEFEMDPLGVLKIKKETWDKEDPMERSFMDILQTIELHDSLAQKGLPLKSYLW